MTQCELSERNRLKMSAKLQRILIIAASLLLIAAVVGLAFYFVSDRDTEKTEEPASTTAAYTTEEIIHDDEEYRYNEDGTLKSIVYYKDNKFNGQIDYFSDKDRNIDYVMTYGADNKEVCREITEKNSEDSPILYRKKVNDEVVQSIEYDYASDGITLKKKTTKNFADDGTESAEKLYFYENGKVSQKCEYTDGVLTSEIFYNEEGNTVEGAS